MTMPDADSHTEQPVRTGRPITAESYGIAAAEAGGMLPWGWGEERLTAARNYWVVTTRPDGRPHAMPVWGVWMEGAFWFGTGTDSVKGRNLAANPRAVVHLESGDEVVTLEGEMAVVTDDAQVRRAGAALNAKYDMGGAEGEEVDLAALGAVFFRMAPHVALGWTEADFPNTATRWVFARE